MRHLHDGGFSLLEVLVAFVILATVATALFRLFSGALGYITPEGDFDLNVVIRSILYNASNHYLSFPTGSAITFYSDPRREWEECLLKAEAMMKVITTVA